ncbi:MAG: LytTR family DNA-binding domain-containing protein [Clostridiales bacterium]|jgi:DNA-binding LytR/AlgR family response regulator|nr:LytTR family DNA-binding domain-containing protein [Clostridiales bacterium]
MYKIAVVEDSPDYTRLLLDYVEAWRKESGDCIRVTTYTDGALLLEDFQRDFDIILMDIEMPLTDGMSAAEEIRKTNSEVVIIFITNLTQYAIRGYAVDALDYMLKPISYFAFKERLNKAIRRIKGREAHYITINENRTVKKLQTTDIHYVECRNHTLMFHTEHGVISTTGKLGDIEDKLKEYHFFRSNNCYLINLRYVDTVRGSCTIVAGKELMISQPRKKAFIQAFTNYVGGW